MTISSKSAINVYILSLALANFHITEADMNDDAFVNIYDVTILIDYILNM